MHDKVSRRGVLQGGLTAAAALATSPAAQAASRERPNILWFVSEDNFPYVGAYGDPIAHTPTIDAMAARGILYRHAYASGPVCAVSRFAILTGIHAQSCAPAQHMRANAILPSELRTYPEYLRQAGYYCTNNSKTDYNSNVEPDRIWDESSETAHWRGRPAGQPFMAVFNSMTTHESRLFQPTPGRVGPADVRVPAYLPDVPEIRSDFASYYNLIEKMDGELAAKLAELQADGLAEDTIVFHYSDHGGALARSKRYCYDDGLRCVLIVYLPPKWAHLAPQGPGTAVDSPVSLVDLAPTLLSLAGLPVAPQMQGKAFLGQNAGVRSTVFGARDRMDERYDMVRTATDGRFRYIRNYLPHRPWGMHGAFEWTAKGYQGWEREMLAGRLDEAQMRFFQPKPYEELYDLQSDRDELRNRIADPALASVRRALRQAVDREMLAITDNGFIPEGSQLEGYRESRAAGAYPLRQVMQLAQVAARGDRRKLAVLRKALKHDHYVMRYWGAIGLAVLGEGAAPAVAELEQIARGDSSSHVRVAAAEAWLRAAQAPAAVALLAGLAMAPQAEPVRLYALNSLTENLDLVRTPAVHAAATAGKADGDEYLQRAGSYLLARLDGTYDPMTSNQGSATGPWNTPRPAR